MGYFWITIVGMLFFFIILVWAFKSHRNMLVCMGVVLSISASCTTASYVKAATLEERIAQYKETHIKTDISKYIFIGDSRTVGMQMSVQGDNDIWACRESIGYDWMVSDGIPSVEAEISEDSAVFILLGINDLGNSAAYADYVNNKAAEWPCTTYFVSVGPVGDTTVTNSQIEDFNSVIGSMAASYKYLDLYNSMVSDGYETVDGLHYTSGTYGYIYDFLKSQ